MATEFDWPFREQIEFRPFCNRNTERMTAPPRGIVFHWTGAENPATRVISTLKKRELSIHFVIEKDGTIVQTANLDTRCAHAGVANDFLGCEIVGRGFARREDVKGSSLRERTELDWSEPRDVYRDDIAGKRIHFSAFYPRQIIAVLKLSEHLAGTVPFPRRIPERVVKKPSELYAIQREDGLWIEPDFSRVYRRWRNPRVRDFRGVMGHFHVHKTKCDPGTQIFRSLWAEGFNSLDQRFPSWQSDSRFL